MLPSPNGIMSSTSSNGRLVDASRHIHTGAPPPSATIYQSVYSPNRPMPSSNSMPVQPPDYHPAAPRPHPTSQLFPSMAKVVPELPPDETQVHGYRDLRAIGPSHAGVPVPQRLPSLSEQHPPRPADSISYSSSTVKRTPIQPTMMKQQPGQIPISSPDSRRHSQVLVPNLLDESRTEALKDIKFRLRLRQQPKAARSCGFGERDRRVIDPPPIVELMIESPTLSEEEIRTYRCYESYIMSCSIWDESGQRDASYMPEEYRHQRRLMGSLVGTPFVGKDEHGKEGCFFTFSDLSCRTPGSFRLKFSVIMIDPIRAGMIRHFPILTEVQSDVFTVYNAKDFPGMVASTQLAHSLKAQGCILQLKKGNDKSKNPKGAPDMSDDDFDDQDDDTELHGRRKRRSIRQ
ncbi:RYP2-like protein [Paramyrothecium foliicola]|nr:RYP2-like protein [Paramyrothecium foliicola]